jgi:hypothetical protein
MVFTFLIARVYSGFREQSFFIFESAGKARIENECQMKLIKQCRYIQCDWCQ